MWRAVRSYVRRSGRMTAGQQRALDQLWPSYGISDYQQAIDFNEVFGRQAAIILDIGFGNGEALATTARAHPENNYLAVEVYRPGIGQLLLQIEQHQLCNIRIVEADICELLKTGIADNYVHTVNIFFPDPWPKKRHHKRRLVQTDFIRQLLPKIVLGGTLHLATDWRNYAEQMMKVLSDIPELTNKVGRGQLAPRPDDRPSTKFERRGLSLGHGVYDLLFTRTT